MSHSTTLLQFLSTVAEGGLLAIGQEMPSGKRLNQKVSPEDALSLVGGDRPVHLHPNGGFSKQVDGTHRWLIVEWDTIPVDRQREHASDLGLPTPTAIVFSGNRSLHYWYRFSSPTPQSEAGTLKSILKDLGADPALATWNHSIRCPGSIHPATGKRAELLEFNPDASITLKDLSFKSRKFRLLENAGQGNRNNTLNAVAFALAAAYPDEQDLLRDELYDVAVGIGLDPAEVSATLSSAFAGADRVVDETPRAKTRQQREKRAARAAQKNTPDVSELLPYLSERFGGCVGEDGDYYLEDLETGVTLSLTDPAVTDILSSAWLDYAGVALTDSKLSSLRYAIRSEMCAGDIRPVHFKVAPLADPHQIGGIVRLGGEAWEISKSGLRKVTGATAPLFRDKGRGVKPKPFSGTAQQALEVLRDYLGVAEETLVTLLPWLTFCFLYSQEYPILLLNGEQNSGKSTLVSNINALFGTATVLQNLETSTDLLPAAFNSHIIVADNISGLTKKESNLLCSLATRGGLSFRKLYSQLTITVPHANPLVLSGIDVQPDRPDLADRCVKVFLPRLTVRKILPPKDVAAALGAALSLTQQVLANLDLNHESRCFRMALYSAWCESFHRTTGMDASSSLESQHQSLLEDSLANNPLASAILALLEKQPTWSGTAQDLLSELTRRLPNGQWAYPEATDPLFPNSARRLGNALKIITQPLEKVGVRIVNRRTATARLIELFAAPSTQVEPVEAPTEPQSAVAPEVEIPEVEAPVAVAQQATEQPAPQQPSVNPAPEPNPPAAPKKRAVPTLQSTVAGKEEEFVAIQPTADWVLDLEDF